MTWDLKIDFPGMVLILVMLLMLWLVWSANRSAENKLNVSEMLQDENGKASSGRLAMFVALAVSSWAIMYVLITRKGEIDTWMVVAYIGIWSGAKVAEKALDVYGNRGIPAPSPVPRPPIPVPTPRPRPVVEDDEGETDATTRKPIRN